jgi:hypothetical protein
MLDNMSKGSVLPRKLVDWLEQKVDVRQSRLMINLIEDII